MKEPPSSPSPGGGGFSLPELLVVIAIIALLLGLVGGVLPALLHSHQLTTASGRLVDTLRYARQEAMIRKKPIAFHFDLEPGRMGFQPFIVETGIVKSETGDDAVKTRLVPLMKRQFLGSSVRYLGDPEHSPLLGSAREPVDPFIPDTPPAAGLRRVFRFLPTGNTDLPADRVWCVTLAAAPGEAGDTLPKHFITLQVDALSGTILIYQP